MKKVKGFKKTTTVNPEETREPEIKKDGKSDELSNKNIIANLGDAPYVVFALDSTGSMASCIQECRDNLRDLIKQLLTDNPRTRVGFVLFGDYCDGQRCISIKDFSDDADEIIEFVKNTPNTGGGDIPEAYELVLHRVAEMGWTEQGGALVLVGDAYPHPAQDGNPQNNPDHLDWQEEIQNLLKKNVKVFPCQCLYQSTNIQHNAFWSDVASLCQTPLLKMDFKDSSFTLGAIAYATTSGEAGLRGFAAKGSTVMYACSSDGFAANLSTLTDYTKSVNKDKE